MKYACHTRAKKKIDTKIAREKERDKSTGAKKKNKKQRNNLECEILTTHFSRFCCAAVLFSGSTTKMMILTLFFFIFDFWFYLKHWNYRANRTNSVHTEFSRTTKNEQFFGVFLDWKWWRQEKSKIIFLLVGLYMRGEENDNFPLPVNSTWNSLLAARIEK